MGRTFKKTVFCFPLLWQKSVAAIFARRHSEINVIILASMLLFRHRM